MLYCCALQGGTGPAVKKSSNYRAFRPGTIDAVLCYRLPRHPHRCGTGVKKMFDIEGYLITVPLSRRSRSHSRNGQGRKTMAVPAGAHPIREHQATWTPHTMRWESIRCLFSRSFWTEILHPAKTIS
jgi:hypothetical protein